MIEDTTTFFLAFSAVFGGLAYWMWRMQRTAADLQARLEALEALEPPETRETTNAKTDGDAGPTEA